MLNPIEKFKRSILHLNRSLHHCSVNLGVSPYCHQHHLSYFCQQLAALFSLYDYTGLPCNFLHKRNKNLFHILSMADYTHNNDQKEYVSVSISIYPWQNPMQLGIKARLIFLFLGIF